MKILVVDNGTVHLDNLLALCGRDNTSVVPVTKLRAIPRDKDLVVVLSGSSTKPVLDNDDYFRTELNIIDAAATPIIGVCLGFELIAHQAGGQLVKMPHKESSILDVFPTPEGTNWFGPYHIPVIEGHRWTLRDAPPGYIELANSTDGVEAIGNLSKHIIGFQFHPEYKISETDGSLVFRRVLERITRDS